MKTNALFWEKNREIIRSKQGGAIFATGTVLSHGHSLLEDLVGNVTYFQYLILVVTGNLVEKRLADWVEASFLCVSWPDPRIWCNHIGALSGSLQVSPVSATMAGVLAADSRMYGSRPVLQGSEFISKALIEKNAGISVEEIVSRECEKHKGKPSIMGYARPMARGDERVAALERVTEQLNFHIGEHLKLAYEIQDILLRDYNETMNINGYFNAFLLDQGFSPIENYRLVTFCVASGVLGCYIDTYDNYPESFLPMRCDDIDYQGKPIRQVPNKEDS